VLEWMLSCLTLDREARIAGTWMGRASRLKHT
jgi:hypothetical protein